MSIQITRPTLGAWQATANALVGLTTEFSGLPAPYIVIPTAYQSQVKLQADSPADFELWRAALMVEPGGVGLRAFRGSVWLEAVAQYRGVTVVLTGFGVPLTPEQAVPQPSAGQLAEQQHQFGDVAVPPLACETPRAAVAA